MRTARQPSSTVRAVPMMSTTSWLLMNSQMPSLARTMKASSCVSSCTLISGCVVTPTLQQTFVSASSCTLLMEC